MTRAWFALVLICMVVTAPALASTISATNVGKYSVSANPGNVIYKIKIGDLPIGTNQTHTLMYNGYPYLLTINTWTDYGLWKNAQISLTMPNGTVQTSHTAASTVVGSYSTIIQPTMRSDSSVLESGTATFLTVDLNIGLVPASAQFSTAPMGYNPSASLPISSASGYLGGQRTSVYAYQVSKQDFTNTIENYNPSAGVGDLGSAVFQWTWNGILGFLNMIPVVGPIAAEFLTMAGEFLSGAWYWVSFLWGNLPAILLTLESLILMAAVLKARKGRRAMSSMAGNVINYNIAVVTGILTAFAFIREWVVRLVEMIAGIVKALIPI